MTDSLRGTWTAGRETLGLWLSTPSSVIAESAARQPVDYVCVDTQHGVIDYQSSVSMIQAIELSGGTPVVRVPWNEPGIIGKTLDGRVTDWNHGAERLFGYTAAEMIGAVKGLAAVRGYRGLPRGDLAALAQAVARFSRLAHMHDIFQAEINPLAILPEGQGVAVLDALAVPTADAGYD